MKLTIAHLYPDSMSLYGEYANIAVLRRHLEAMGVEAAVRNFTCEDPPDFSDADFIYMGAGTERRQKSVLIAAPRCAPALKAAAEKGAVILFTGNAMETLGDRKPFRDLPALQGEQPPDDEVQKVRIFDQRRAGEVGGEHIAGDISLRPVLRVVAEAQGQTAEQWRAPGKRIPMRCSVKYAGKRSPAVPPAARSSMREAASATTTARRCRRSCSSIFLRIRRTPRRRKKRGAGPL